MNPGPGGLYLHVPFCSAICPYCDFAVLTGAAGARRAFAASLRAEMDLWRDAAADRDTVYLGGGTPTALEVEDLLAILEKARSTGLVAADAVVHLEANPEDVTSDSLAAWRKLDVRFLSLGVQSFDPGELRFLGRRHDPAEARRAVDLAVAAGFETVSIDLIFGLPDQDLAVWQRNLTEAATRGADHVSCYQLTVHEGTPFARRREHGGLVEMGRDEQADFFLRTHDVLVAAGFEGYEVSNFARGKAHRSRHNQKYWRHAPYLGLGPSAHSFDGTRRWWNIRDHAAWSAAVARGERPVEEEERLEPESLALEALMLGLRMAEGVDLADFRRRFGVDLALLNAEHVAEAERAGHLVVEAGRLRPTVRGMAVADAMAASFEVAPS